MFAARELPDGSAIVLIADASAKGTLGRLHAEMLCAAFLTSVAAEDCPSGTLDRLNSLHFNIPRAIGIAYFASAVVARINPTGNFLTYASAGHDPALVISGNGHTHLAPTGPVLGLFADCRYSKTSVAFGSRDTLVLATDGVSETRGTGTYAGQFGTDGIVKSLARWSGDIADASAAVMHQCDVFCSNDYRDDATLAAIYTGIQDDRAVREKLPPP